MPLLLEPKAGLVIGYAYLWHDQAARGRIEGAKDRPCVIVLSVRKQGATTIITVAPVTHTPPRVPQFALEIPGMTKRRLGLDDQRSWIMLNDFNQFIWPSADLRTIDRKGAAFAYGELPARLYRTLQDRVLALLRAGQIEVTYRAP